MQLQTLDWVIVFSSIAVCFIPALFFARRSSKSTSEFFVSGRSVPWWLAGLSMVATTFSTDTPNLVTDIVRREGVAGNWQWWAFVLTGVATVFFYARLWRRSGVMTDLEFYEIRYSGTPASMVRGFRAIYLGLLFNCMMMASVNLAACKIANILFGIEPWVTLVVCGLLNVVFAAHSGLWGVLVIDMIQFFVMMAGVFAAAYFALQHSAVGGLTGMVEKLSDKVGPNGLNYLNMLPNFSNQWDLAIAVFIMPIAVQWWACWYAGAEPGGGSYIAQRMLASKSEKDALGGVLFFNVAHYVFRPWPWIIVALCSIIVYPTMDDIQLAFPHVQKSMLKDDIAYPAMLKFLPVGWIGLMVGGLIAANSSTILTHLNWGASYLVHDFYRRFIRKDASEKHYVFMGRVATVFLFLCASGLMFCLDSAKETFDIVLQIGAGTGLLYLVRWFWWRVTAWCEIVAMISSFAVSVCWFVMHKAGIYIYGHGQWFWMASESGLDGDVVKVPNTTHIELLLTVIATTICWMLTAYLGPQTDRATLISFYKKVYPPGLGWEKIRKEAGVSVLEARANAENLPLALFGWFVGCTVIWSSLFTIGNFLYGRYDLGIILGIVFIVSSAALIYVVNRIWSRKEA